MEDYAKKRKLIQVRRILISSCFLENGTIITPLLLFYLDLQLFCKKVYRFVKYTAMKCFNNFIQSAVNARVEGDENPNFSVVTETLKLLANSSYGNQIMDPSRHTVTKFLIDKKTHGVINKKMLKSISYINDHLYEAELIKSETEHKEPISVRFFLLQYAKFRTLDLYYDVIDMFCDVRKFEELEMHTVFQYLALSEDDWFDCIRPAKKKVWNSLRSGDCTDELSANSTTKFFPSTCCAKYEEHDRGEPGLVKEELRCTEMICLCSKTYCCYDSQSNNIKFSSKGLDERTLEDIGCGPMSKNRKVLEKVIKVTSTERGFRRKQHAVSTYDQTRRGFSYFYPRRNVQQDGRYTCPHNIEL